MNTAGIVQVPDPVLRARCAEVTEFGADLKALALRLAASAGKPGRVGVAAPQIGVALRMFAIGLGPAPRVYVNPRIMSASGEQTGREGCLSVAERWFDLARAAKVTVSAQDVRGDEFVETFDGLFARAIQHEIDHLNGVLVIDRAREQLPLLTRQQRRATERELRKVTV